MKTTIYSLLTMILATGTVQASSLTYECTPESGNATAQTLEISDSQIKVESPDSLNGMKFLANLDESYRPRLGSQKVRFLGKESGNSRKVLLYSLMLKGARMGYVQIQGNEDGYWSAEYKCFLKK